jgi:hypothetical protein
MSQPAALHSFDWKLHYVVASDSAAGIRAPLLRLQLFLAGACGRGRRAAGRETLRAPRA